MKIAARITNQHNTHTVEIRTNERAHSLAIPPKPDGFGSSVNGGELLFLALATCYCNDLYREAKKRGLSIECVEVDVAGEFGAEGEPARNITYQAVVQSDAPEEEVLELMRHTNSVAEIQNTLRRSNEVTLTNCSVRRGIGGKTRLDLAKR